MFKKVMLEAKGLTPILTPHSSSGLRMRTYEGRGVVPPNIQRPATSVRNHLSVRNYDLCASLILVPLQELASGQVKVHSAFWSQQWQHLFHFEYFHYAYYYSLMMIDCLSCHNKDIQKGFITLKFNLTDSCGTHFTLISYMLI